MMNESLRNKLLSDANTMLPKNLVVTDNPRLIQCPIDKEAQELEAAAMAELYTPEDLDPEYIEGVRYSPAKSAEMKETRTKLIEKDVSYIRTCDDEILSTVLIEGGVKTLKIIAECPEMFAHLLERHGTGLDTQWTEWFGLVKLNGYRIDREKIAELTNTVKMHSIMTLLDLLDESD